MKITKENFHPWTVHPQKIKTFESIHVVKYKRLWFVSKGSKFNQSWQQTKLIKKSIAIIMKTISKNTVKMHKYT